MCGICGFVGTGNIKEILLKDLHQLEYRGYDSSGMAIRNNHKISVFKSVGEISYLDKQLKNIEIGGSCGIAHTRWATHGKATLENCHPHLSNNGKWAIVHNGIIENYLSIKNMLLAKGYKFLSQTDTEVVVNLIQDNDNVSPIRAVISATKKLQGSFALAIMNSERDVIYLAKRTSPLYVAKTSNGYKISSDISTFFGCSNSCFILQDDQYAMVTSKSATFFNQNGEKIKPIECDVKSSSLDNMTIKEPHYMLKEIKDIPMALSSTYRHILSTIDEDKIRKFCKGIKKVCIIGCGTAYHAGLVGANYLEKIGLHTDCYVASEFRYANHKIDKQTLYIFVSQSGETADTLACAQYVRDKKCKSIAITNVVHSSINKIVNIVFPTTAGKEIAVASTKAYNCQCLAFYILACIMKKIKYQAKCEKLIKDYSIPKFDNSLVGAIKNSEKVFFVGRDWDVVTCNEASLKLKEITYINCMAIAGGELKHGTLALVDDKTLVIVICTREHIADKIANCIHEIKSRRGKVVLVTTLDFDFGEVDKIIKLKSYKNDFDPITTIIPLQQLAYYTSVDLGYNPDKPRNLAKSVTVE